MDSDKEPLEIDISELLQLVLSLQAEVGIISDLILDILKTGDLSIEELTRALQSINEISAEALDYISGEPEPEDLGPGNDGNESTNNVH